MAMHAHVGRIIEVGSMSWYARGGVAHHWDEDGKAEAKMQELRLFCQTGAAVLSEGCHMRVCHGVLAVCVRALDLYTHQYVVSLSVHFLFMSILSRILHILTPLLPSPYMFFTFAKEL